MPSPNSYKTMGGWYALDSAIWVELRFECEQLDRLFETYAGLLQIAHDRVPDIVEMTALASVLHSFYNGIENIFLSIAKRIDGSVPTGIHWHRDLLNSMTRETPARPALLDEELSRQLTDYLAFRHFYRHAYSFLLEWEKLDVLVAPLPTVWQQCKKRIEMFQANIPENRNGI